MSATFVLPQSHVSSASVSCACNGSATYPGNLLRCSSISCGKLYHERCVTGLCASYGAAASGVAYTAVAHRWRCPECRAMAMKPDCKVAILGTCKLLRQAVSAPVEVTLSFSTPLGLSVTGRTRLMLACMPMAHGVAGTPSSAQATDGKDISCVWPPGSVIRINGVGSSFAAPTAARDAPSAPLADITSVLLNPAGGSYASSTAAAALPRTSFITVSAPRTAQVAPAYAIVVMHCSPRDISGWVEDIALSKCLKASLCYGALKGRLEAKRRGSWYGLADSERLDLARLLRCPWMNTAMAGGPAVAYGQPTSAADVQTITTYASPHKEPEPVFLDSSADIISLQDPLTQNCISIPVRGEFCDHTRNFDLRTYLQSNLGDVAIPAAKRWLCPLCGIMAVPCQLWVDTVVVGLLKALSAGVYQGSLTRAPGLNCATLQYRPVSAGPPIALGAGTFAVTSADKAGQSSRGTCNLDVLGYALPHAAVEAGVRLDLNSDVGGAAGSGATGATSWKLDCTKTVGYLWLDEQSAARDGQLDELDEWEGDDDTPTGVGNAAAFKLVTAAPPRSGVLPSTPSGAMIGSSSAAAARSALGVGRSAPAAHVSSLSLGTMAASAYLSRAPSFSGAAGGRGESVIDLSFEDQPRSIGAKSSRPAAGPSQASGSRPLPSAVIDLLDDPDDPVERAKRRKAAGYIPTVATLGMGR